MNNLELILSINKDLQKRQQVLIPYLVAPSGYGKTSIVEEYCAKRGLKLVKFLLGTMLEYDVLGLLKEKNGTAEWCLSSLWDDAVKEGCVVFLDELDKAREEVVAAVLTVITSREVLGRKLHPDTIIIAGGQELPGYDTATNEAFSQRIIPVAIEVQEAISFLNGKYGVDLSFLKFPPVEIKPVHKISPRTVEYALAFIKELFKRKEISKKYILETVLPPEILKRLVEGVQNTLSAVDYFEVLTLEDVRTMPIEALITLSPYIYDGDVNKSAQLVKAFLTRIWTECGEDECREVIDGIARHMYEKYAEYDGQEIEVALPGASIEELYQEMKEAAETIARVWEEAKNEKKKS